MARTTALSLSLLLACSTLAAADGWCRLKEFQCKGDSRCISSGWRCDGDNDCADGSDEAKELCDASNGCARGLFRCKYGEKCIPAEWRCDGDNDCADGSDEAPKEECLQQRHGGTRKPRLGKITARGLQKDLFFSIAVEEESFLFALNCTNYWSIKKFESSGKLGTETDTGHVNHQYSVLFPLYVDGRSYIFGLTQNETYYFIQGVLPGGKLSEDTDSGNWHRGYAAQVAITVGGKTYLYGQSQKSLVYFVQEILPGGKLGKETASGYCKNAHDTFVPIVVRSKTFLYGYSRERRFIQEILPGGLIGREVSFWEKPEEKLLAQLSDFIIGRNWDGWFIRKVTPDGTLEGRIFFGNWNYFHSSVAPFSVSGNHYLYIQNGCDWSIHKVFTT